MVFPSSGHHWLNTAFDKFIVDKSELLDKKKNRCIDAITRSKKEVFTHACTPLNPEEFAPPSLVNGPTVLEGCEVYGCMVTQAYRSFDFLEAHTLFKVSLISLNP